MPAITDYYEPRTYDYENLITALTRSVHPQRPDGRSLPREQVVASPHAESTILHIASLPESLSPVRDQHPAL
jgi:nitrate reductase beta subunit